RVVLAATTCFSEHAGEVCAALRAFPFVDPGERFPALGTACEAGEQIAYDTVRSVPTAQRSPRAKQRLHSGERRPVHDRRVVAFHRVERLSLPTLSLAPEVGLERADDRRVARDLRDVGPLPVLGASEGGNV